MPSKVCVIKIGKPLMWKDRYLKLTKLVSRTRGVQSKAIRKPYPLMNLFMGSWWNLIVNTQDLCMVILQSYGYILFTVLRFMKAIGKIFACSKSELQKCSTFNNLCSGSTADYLWAFSCCIISERALPSSINHVWSQLHLWRMGRNIDLA